MKLIVTTMLLAVLAGGVAAQITPGADETGIYFDLNGWVFCTATSAPFQSVSAYLLITTPSATEALIGWEARSWIMGSAVAPSWSLEYGVDNDPDPWNYDVSFPPVLPSGSTILLATWTGFILSPVDMVTFHLTGVPGSSRFPDSPGYLTNGIVPLLYPLHIALGPGDVVAMINECVTGNADSTFSLMKTLFR